MDVTNCLFVETIERVAVICDVAVCIVFVIECEGDEFLFAWGLGKRTSTTGPERIGNRGLGTNGQMPDEHGPRERADRM